MWAIRWFLTILLLIYASLFAAVNMTEVTLHLPLWGLQLRLALAVIVLCAIFLGCVLWAVVSFFGTLDLRRKLHRIERRNVELKAELTRLRNLPLLPEEDLGSEELKPTSPVKGEQA